VKTSAVIFPIGEDLYAVDAITVREVVADPQPTRLPTAPSVFFGVFNLRGEVVPMLDTAALLGIGTLAEASIAVVVNTAAGPAALVVSGLPKFAVLDHAIGPSELRGTLGVYKVEEGIAVLVDIEALLLPHTNLGASALTDAVVGR
jgi:purine-binding chemotaxis protein CheW